MIKVFVTGGTFDKEYNELNGNLFFKDTHVQSMLDLGRSKVKVSINTLMLIDSLDMTESDRNVILHNCKKAVEDKILITHGTDTMVNTARLLGLNITNKTVVITGAMVPYTFGSSDGLFNFGSAIGFVQSLPPGVYIAMNGKYFHWNNVRKDKNKGEFTEKRPLKQTDKKINKQKDGGFTAPTYIQ